MTLHHLGFRCRFDSHYAVSIDVTCQHPLVRHHSACSMINSACVSLVVIELSPGHVVDCASMRLHGSCRLRVTNTEGSCLRRRHEMRTVLFVCSGNTCRSPMAAALFNKLASERGWDWRAESAGIRVSSGSAASSNACLAMKAFSGWTFLAIAADKSLLNSFDRPI